MSTAEALFQEREQRVADAIQLKVPDRVPMFLWFHQFPAQYAGITLEEAYYDLDQWLAAYEKAITDFEPDLYLPPEAGVFTGGKVHELLDNQQIKWPGHGVPADVSFQFVEGEYMKPEDYDHFLADPTDFTLRTYMPRVFGALEGFGMLPPLMSFTMGYAGAGLVGALAAPPVAASLQVLMQAAGEAALWTQGYATFRQKMRTLGFPAWIGGVAIVPFDLASDMLRGMRGAMVDMYRRPEKLLALEERVLPMLIGSAIAGCQMSGVNRVFIALHRGADGFMSLEQFETFYWPGLKAMIHALIDAGITPCPFFEGIYDQRLEYLRELPKGKVMGVFDRTDLAKAKEVLGDTMCIAAGMPPSYLQGGTPEQVREHTKKVIDVAGKDGGFIMTSATVLDDARPELVKAWVEATQEYGGY
jgi:hypothetical protein